MGFYLASRDGHVTASNRLVYVRTKMIANFAVKKSINKFSRLQGKYLFFISAAGGLMMIDITKFQDQPVLISQTCHDFWLSSRQNYLVNLSKGSIFGRWYGGTHKNSKLQKLLPFKFHYSVILGTKQNLIIGCTHQPHIQNSHLTLNLMLLNRAGVKQDMLEITDMGTPYQSEQLGTVYNMNLLQHLQLIAKPTFKLVLAICLKGSAILVQIYKGRELILINRDQQAGLNAFCLVRLPTCLHRMTAVDAIAEKLNSPGPFDGAIIKRPVLCAMMLLTSPVSIQCLRITI